MAKSLNNDRQRAFILRCWLEDGSDDWRFNLELIGQDGQRTGFENLDDLVSFIDQMLDRKKGVFSD